MEKDFCCDIAKLSLTTRGCHNLRGYLTTVQPDFFSLVQSELSLRMDCCPSLCKCKSQKREEVKLLIIGLDGSGKTSIIKYLQKDFVEKVVPTRGFSSIRITNNKKDIEIYDLGGNSSIRGIWKNYYGLVHGIIFVIDSSDKVRLDEVKECFSKTISHKKISGKPILIFFNKQDIESALDEVELSQEISLNALVNKYECPAKVESCSVYNPWRRRIKDNPIIERGYRWLLLHIDYNWVYLKERVESDTKHQQDLETKVMNDRFKRFRFEIHKSDKDSDQVEIKNQLNISSEMDLKSQKQKESIVCNAKERRPNSSGAGLKSIRFIKSNKIISRDQLLKTRLSN